MQVSQRAIVFLFCGLEGIFSALYAQETLPAQDTRQEFQQICDSVRQSRENFYGLAQTKALQAMLQSKKLSAEDQIVGHAILAGEMLRHGDPAEAVRLLQDARRMVAEQKLSEALDVKLLLKLGLANLRLGEVNNCVQMHTPEMCLLPIQANGQHKDRTGAQAALEALLAFTARAPDSFTGQWLLNIAAMTLGQWPDAVPEAFRISQKRLESEQDIGRFADIAHQVGLHLFDNAGGAAMDDFDGDGLLDIVTSSMNPCTPMHFFQNNGHGGFVDRTAASGLDQQMGGLNLTHADYDNDGDLDIFVLRGGWMGADGRMRNSLLMNDGKGHFTDVTLSAGLAWPAYPTQTAAWADIDLDGDLDLYIGNEDPGNSDAIYPSQLFRNNGDKTFTDIAEMAGVVRPGFVKGVAFGDIDNDGDPDLYVSCIGPNRLYRNNGNSTFIEEAAKAGVVEPAGRSFATWFFDYDNDGNLDLFVADYSASVEEIAAHFLRGAPSSRHPRLYHNEGGSSFKDVSVEKGLTAPSLAMGANFGDLDNDGFLDFYLGTGDPNYETLTPNLMYRNDAGRRFVDVTYSGGFGHLQKGHAVAFGDLDNDGDQDIFEQMGGAFPGDAYHSVLYENPGHANSWITLRLVGVRANRFGVGARIQITAVGESGKKTAHIVVGTGGSFGSSSLQQEIGLGNTTKIEALQILWPGSSNPQVFRDVAVNAVYEVREDATQLLPLHAPKIPFQNSHAEHKPPYPQKP